MKHLRWEQAGRTLSLPTGERVYKALINQRNTLTELGEFVPYIWENNTLRYFGGALELRFSEDGSVEHVQNGIVLAKTSLALERKSFGVWQQEPTKVRIEKLPDEDDLEAIAYGRVAVVLENERATAKHIFVAGSRHRVRGDTSLKAHKPGEYRVVVEHQHSSNWLVAWLPSEEATRRVVRKTGHTRVEFEPIRRRVYDKKAPELWVSPDTYGPTTNVGSGDDSQSDNTSFWIDGIESAPGNTVYEWQLYVDDLDPGPQDCVGLRWVVSLPGASAINAGTQISCNRSTGDNGSGGAHTVRVKCENSQTPATGSSGSRPFNRSYRSASTDVVVPANNTTLTINVQSLVSDLLSAGYTYNGGSDAILFGVGGANLFGITGVSWSHIASDDRHATGTPAQLTIVYTSGFISGSTSGSSTAKVFNRKRWRRFSFNPIRGSKAAHVHPAFAFSNERAATLGKRTNAGALFRNEFFESLDQRFVVGTSSGASTTTATLSGGAPSGSINGSTAGVATATANLIGRGALSGSVTSTASATGALTGRGTLSGSVAGVATTSGAVTGRGTLSGSVAGVATVNTSTLAGSGVLASSVSGVATVNASVLAGTGALTGSIAGTATASLLVDTGAMTASTSGAATASATLSASGALAGSIAGVATTTAAIHGSVALTGSSAGVSTPTGSLSGAGAVAASAAGVASVTGSIAGVGAIAGTVAGVATLNAATLFGIGSLSALVVGVATVNTPALTGSGVLTGSASGASTATLFPNPGAASGTAAGAATVAGSLIGLGAISGASAGVATTSVSASGQGALTGAIAAFALAAAALLGVGSMSGTGAGSTTTTAALVGQSALVASTAGTAACSATGSAGVSCVGFAAGSTTCSATGSLFGFMVGVTSGSAFALLGQVAGPPASMVGVVSNVKKNTATIRVANKSGNVRASIRIASSAQTSNASSSVKVLPRTNGTVKV